MESCQARPAVRPVIPDLRYISCQRTVCWKFRRRNTHHRVADRSRHNAVCRAEKDAGSRSSESTEDSLSPEQQEEEEEELDNLLKKEFGVERVDQLTEVQKKYKEKILAKLEEEREAERRRLEARSADFNRGKYFYERGQYPEAVAALTRALNAEGPFSQLGGEVQLWLALAYQATGKEQECIDMYKALENTHPNPAIKRQAANLRYILEAPKLQLGPDERVSVPLLEQDEIASRSAKKTYGRARAPTPGTKRERPKSLEEKFMEEYTPPRLIPNKYVAVAAAVLAVALACYSAYISKL